MYMLACVRQTELGSETEPGINFLHTTVLSDLVLSSSPAVSSAMSKSSTLLSSMQPSASQTTEDVSVSKTTLMVSPSASSKTGFKCININ